MSEIRNPANRLAFSGVLERPFDIPGMVLPVFWSPDFGPCVQHIDEKNVIYEFAELEEESKKRVIEGGEFPLSFPSDVSSPSRFYARGVGDDALYAVRFPDGDTVLQSYGVLQHIVSIRISEFRATPNVELEMSKFYDLDRAVIVDAENRAEINIKRHRSEIQKIQRLRNEARELLNGGEKTQFILWLLRNVADHRDCLPRVLHSFYQQESPERELLIDSARDALRETCGETEHADIFAAVCHPTLLSAIENPRLYEAMQGIILQESSVDKGRIIASLLSVGTERAKDFLKKLYKSTGSDIEREAHRELDEAIATIDPIEYICEASSRAEQMAGSADLVRREYDLALEG